MSEVLLAARALRVGYNDVPVVRGIDLDVRAGEVVVLLGPNGAGKSTTLLALAGELRLLSGSVELFGMPASGRLDRRVQAGLAFVPEERGIFSELTTAENLRLGRGGSARALALAPELEPLHHRRAGLLSGGEQRILVLARALAASPRLIIADELSLGLAPVVFERMLSTLRRAADQGAGVLMVEQHARQVLRCADRGYVMRRGSVEFAGTAAVLTGRLAEIEGLYLSAGANGSARPTSQEMLHLSLNDGCYNGKDEHEH